MIGNSLRLGKVKGIEVGLHWSWLIVAVFLTWSLAGDMFPALYPGWSGAEYWVVGALASILLFGSVVAHEFGHALTAQRFGVGVRSITLFLFGGVATLERDTDRPKAEFWIAAMGPVVSIVLGGIFYGLRGVAAPFGEPVVALLTYLAATNGLLVLFNLIPAFPLDGGRVLRAIVWASTGSYERATLLTSRVGQGFAFLMIFVGVARILGGNVFGGLWTMLLGWFLLSAAGTSAGFARLRDALEVVTVRDLMRTEPPIVGAAVPLAGLVRERILPRAERAHVVMVAGRLAGVVTLTDVRRYPQEEWERTTVGEAMTPRMRLRIANPDTPLIEALHLLSAGDHDQLPVLDGERLVGLLRRSDVMRYLDLRAQLGVNEVEPRAVAATAPTPRT